MLWSFQIWTLSNILTFIWSFQLLGSNNTIYFNLAETPRSEDKLCGVCVARFWVLRAGDCRGTTYVPIFPFLGKSKILCSFLTLWGSCLRILMSVHSRNVKNQWTWKAKIQREVNIIDLCPPLRENTKHDIVCATGKRFWWIAIARQKQSIFCSSLCILSILSYIVSTFGMKCIQGFIKFLREGTGLVFLARSYNECWTDCLKQECPVLRFAKTLLMLFSPLTESSEGSDQ